MFYLLALLSYYFIYFIFLFVLLLLLLLTLPLLFYFILFYFFSFYVFLIYFLLIIIIYFSFIIYIFIIVVILVLYFLCFITIIFFLCLNVIILRIYLFVLLLYILADGVSWSVALRDSSVLRALGLDLVLLVLFSLQHSLLAWDPVKRACQSALGVLNRAMYCTTTALALQVLMRYWQPVTSAPCLWSVRSAPWDIWFPLICFTVHFLCWAVICSILLIFDYPELLGVKQVYYECLGLGDPLALKSARAQRLYAHLRHPVCVELLLVLWLLPTLTLDRCVLALYLSLYLALAHSLDAKDCAYLSSQLHSKLQLFSAPQGGGAEINSNSAEPKRD
uniref:Nurim n=1 Tax=Astyanax mexicanus TaxID=7994 RepID=A0A3B1KK99_ASTMX